MVHVTFDRPDVLWFLFCIPLLFLTQLATYALKKRVAIKFSHFDLLSKSIKTAVTSTTYQNTVTKKDWLLLTTRAIALTSLILAAAGSNLWYVGKASQSDYIIMIDTSESMTATDIYPDRLQASKEAAHRFAEAVGDWARVGVITFSSVAFVETPPISDKSFVLQKIDEIEVSGIGGTDIGGAIVTGTNLLRAGDRQKSIVLITDGRSNQGVALLDAVEYAQGENVVIHAIGVGTETGGLLEDFPLIPFTIDEEGLGQVTNMTGGSYFRATDSAKLSSAFSEIANVQERLLTKSLVPGLIVLVLFLLFFEWGFLGATYRVVP